MQQREWEINDSNNLWILVDVLALPAALQVLGSALRELNHPMTAVKFAADDFALITTVGAIEAIARKNDNVEVRQAIGGNEKHEIAFLWASPAVTRDVLIQLGRPSNEKSSPLLLATPSAYSPTSIKDTGVSIQPTGGRIVVNADRDSVEFEIHLITKNNQPQPVAFEPVKKPIGEAQDNLGLRADWFKRRTGQ